MSAVFSPTQGYRKLTAIGATVCHSLGRDMTLILTRASQSFVVQAVDHRITDTDCRVVDECANKCIVYVCANAAVTISYTGIAILDDLATDEWLVEVLTGQRIDRDAERPRPPLFGYAANCADETIGQAMERMAGALRQGESALSSAALQRWREYPFHLLAGGYQWNRRGHQRPIIGWISKEAGQDACEVRYKQRLWHYRRPPGVPTTLYAAPQTNIAREALVDLTARLQDGDSRTATDLLVAEIRRVADINQWVGHDILSVAIAPPVIAQIYISDHPAAPRLYTPPNPGLGRARMPVSVMPWIIGPGIVRPPTVQSHACTLQVGRYQLDLEGPPVPGNVHFEGSLPRLRHHPPVK